MSPAISKAERVECDSSCAASSLSEAITQLNLKPLPAWWIKWHQFRLKLRYTSPLFTTTAVMTLGLILLSVASTLVLVVCLVLQAYHSITHLIGLDANTATSPASLYTGYAVATLAPSLGALWLAIKVVDEYPFKITYWHTRRITLSEMQKRAPNEACDIATRLSERYPRHCCFRLQTLKINRCELDPILTVEDNQPPFGQGRTYYLATWSQPTYHVARLN